MASGAIVGEVFERKQKLPLTINQNASQSATTGFPAVQHRSKSAFARARDEMRQLGPRPVAIPTVLPTVQPTSTPGPSKLRSPPRTVPDQENVNGDENTRIIENMSLEEIEQEQMDILAKTTPATLEVLRKIREARERRTQQSPADSVPDDPIPTHPPASPEEAHTEIAVKDNPLERVASLPGSPRSPSRADRKLRFAEVTANDVHVYESAPPSPRKKALALPAPDVSDKSSSISLGTWQGKLRDEVGGSEEPDEGTPEYIRRRFFPDQPSHDPTVAWMDMESKHLATADEGDGDGSSGATTTLRFDLGGSPIPPTLASSLPTHLGLHHHAQGELAGYTLDDVFLLSRSTVPAQRATMLSVLSKIAQKLALSKKGQVHEGMEELKGKEEELRKSIVAAGIEAINERGSLGARAVEVVWECVVGWDPALSSIEGVELREGEHDDAISALPLPFLLPQIGTLLSQRALPRESLSQLLAILHRLAQHSNAFAADIVNTPHLIASILQTFLLTPIPPTDDDPLPDPAALHLLTTLVSASRDNATILIEPADALLRFITTTLDSSSSSPFPSHLSRSLLTATLHFYSTLASYGLYSHIATTASTQFRAVAEFVKTETHSRGLLRAWVALLESWMVCATDPHQTSPAHDILWSQIVSWGWGEEVLALRDGLSEVEEGDWGVFAGVWAAEAAWLEGAKVNGVRCGEGERAVAIDRVKDGFEGGGGGKDGVVVNAVIRALHRELDELRSVGFGDPTLRCVRGSVKGLGGYATVLMSAIRLWIACAPPISDGHMDSPPFSLPFSQISGLCAVLVNHPFWGEVYAPGGTPAYAHVFVRPLTGLLVWYLRLAERLPDGSKDLVMAQRVAVLSRLHPGDEQAALGVLDEVLRFVSRETVSSHGWPVPDVIWEKGGVSILGPFLSHVVQPYTDSHVGPVNASPQSIQLTTTLRLPSGRAARVGGGLDFGLPLAGDWSLSPLDHLLRSGSSTVFRALPMDWDASEIDITRSTLLLATIAREVLQRFKLTSFLLTREETVFGCMKIFMLEHGQPQSDTKDEVFRDAIVGQFMQDLLNPFALKSSSLQTVPPSADLEQVALRFLGPATPFFQYYTDFVALYDAVSFSHPLFARLLLPPTSMRYAPDYRKHLWDDFGHVLRSIRTPIDEVLVGDLREYLWPVESDPQLLGAYVRALVKGAVEGFLRFVALHHLACSIWPDLRGGDDVHGDERAGKLLRVLVSQGDDDVVKDVVRYRQARDGLIALPPRCFERPEASAASRLDFIGQVGGDVMLTRLKGLLQ